jgi:glycerol transport system ATP-binding protein
MNLLPCELESGVPRFAGIALQTAAPPKPPPRPATLQIGVRPEFVHFAETGVPVRVERVSDAGRFRVVDTRCGDHIIKLLVDEGQAVPADQGFLHFDPSHTHVYADGWIVT